VTPTGTAADCPSYLLLLLVFMHTSSRAQDAVQTQTDTRAMKKNALTCVPRLRWVRAGAGSKRPQLLGRLPPLGDEALECHLPLPVRARRSR
jgi:hypothetical protein